MTENSTRAKNPAVVLLNFGGPRNLDEVPSFLYEILRDPQVIKFPFPEFLQNKFARKIANKRSGEVSEQYAELGGKSPIVESTERQRSDLQDWLSAQGANLPVYAVHRYLEGQTLQVAQQIVKARHDALYLIPLYPHFSWSTNGTSFEQMRDCLQQSGYKGRLQVMRSYPTQPGYVSAVTDQIRQHLHQHDIPPEETLILCSAHGLPKAYVEAGDPYQNELLATLEELRRAFPDYRFQLSFQSRVGPAEWLRPYTDELIPKLPAQGVTNLVFVGIAFVNDHLETLFEIDRTYFDMARAVGMKPTRVSAIENHPHFIHFLGERSLDWLKGAQGLELDTVLPPSQYDLRYGWFIRAMWWLALAISLHFALV